MNGKPTEPRRFQVAGLFAGIGGIELGFRGAGHETTMLCEIDAGACAVLRHRFPDVPLALDVTKLQRVPKSTTLIAGGFPCQDLSQAGKTKGIAGARSGLVGEVFRLLRCSDVPWVVLENVPFMLSLAKGHALHVILTALEELGYAWAYRVVDARSFGLPQRRQRVYIVASREGDPRRVLFADDVGEQIDAPFSRDVPFGFYWTEGIRGLGAAVDAVPPLKGGSTVGVPSPPAILLPSGKVITPDIRDAERMQGFRAGWTKPAEAYVKTGMRWRLVGNAVSVPAARWLGCRLAQPGDFEPHDDIREVTPGSRWPTAGWNVGEGRYTADISRWPQKPKRQRLDAFLRYDGAPLSERATAGFLNRTQRSSLRFPPGFVAALERHLESVRAR